jgi:glutaredoxin
MMKKLLGIAVFCLLALTAHAATPVQPFEPDSLGRLVASQKGKPFVLVVWSLDCPYCQASMKTLAEERRKRKDLNVVTLSTDSATDAQAVVQIRKKLASVGMSADAWAYGNAPQEQIQYALDPKWHGEKPRSYWFNAKGESVAYSGEITAATVAKLAAR